MFHVSKSRFEGKVGFKSRRKGAAKGLRKKPSQPGRSLLAKPIDKELPEEEDFCLGWLVMESDEEENSEDEEVPIRKPVEKPVEKSKDPLKVEVDLCSPSNKFNHNTNDFCSTVFAVRRGKAFSIKINLNKEFNIAYDRLDVAFMIGPEPKPSKETLISLPVEIGKLPERDPYEWRAHMVKQEKTDAGGSQVTVSVTAAADCPVGNWTLKVTFFKKKAKGMHKKSITVQQPVYILFNPWCEDDQVYMPSQDERQEYVLKQTGRIFTGSSRWIGNRPWNFEPFSKCSLSAAVFLLEESDLNPVAYGNATLVTRTLSAMANANDEDGVLCGNWSGNYEGGTAPMQWTGSRKILEEFMEHKTGVNYGQCWVFSAIITTLGRTLGIPTRSVTNFDSAHDTDGSLTIDKTFFEDGTPLESYDDSVWNFHVWNESWFKRPDLPEGYEGWQAYDATPQESSEGLMQCGPASLHAIKQGELHLPYDARFIFAEVNGSRVTWEINRRGGYKILSMDDDYSVGQKISTKGVGTNEREDVTHLYKYPEGSKEEEMIRTRAYKFACRKKAAALKKYTSSLLVKDVVFDYNGTSSKNGDMVIEVEATNTAQEPRTFDLKCSFNAASYTGSTGKRLSDGTKTVSLEPGQNDKQVWSLKGVDYLNEISDDGMVHVYVTAKVKETGQWFNTDKSYPLEKPDLTMQISNKKPKVGEEITLTMSYKNQLDMELTNGVVQVEGPGIVKELKIPLKKCVPVGGEMCETVKLKPKYEGPREIVASFESRQITNISGAVDIVVQK